MPLVNADIKGLEVVVAAELSNDQVLKQEIRDRVDIHAVNQKAFKLGEGKAGRLIAKIFKFRIIYGGSAYSYAHDPDFMGVSTSEKFWQKVIDAYYEKYAGLKKWHIHIVEEVKRNGILTIPSGRYYQYFPKLKTNGEAKWPETTIKNYPVQGFGADLVMLARIEFIKWFLDSALEGYLVQTIHDSLVVDTPSENCYTIGMLLQQSIEAVPNLCRKHFNYDFSLPVTCELSVGNNKKDLKELILNASTI
jgi:DNA polymerase I